jgi:hypothetical protein
VRVASRQRRRGGSAGDIDQLYNETYRPLSNWSIVRRPRRWHQAGPGRGAPSRASDRHVRPARPDGCRRRRPRGVCSTPA